MNWIKAGGVLAVLGLVCWEIASHPWSIIWIFAGAIAFSLLWRIKGLFDILEGRR